MAASTYFSHLASFIYKNVLNGTLYLNIVIKLIFFSLTIVHLLGKIETFFILKYFVLFSLTDSGTCQSFLRVTAVHRLLVLCPIILSESLLVAIKLHRQQAAVHAA